MNFLEDLDLMKQSSLKLTDVYHQTFRKVTKYSKNTDVNIKKIEGKKLLSMGLWIYLIFSLLYNLHKGNFSLAVVSTYYINIYHKDTK